MFGTAGRIGQALGWPHREAGVTQLLSDAPSPQGLTAIGNLFSGPVDELALDEQKHEVEAVAQPAGGEDRRVHVGHGEELLRLEYALAEPVGGANEHLRHHDD